MDEKEKKKSKRIGIFYFMLFVFLILGGVVTKRVFGHPEFMMMWHLPAAVFLVLSGMKLTEEVRRKNEENLRKRQES